MKILAIEASSLVASVAIINDDVITAEYTINNKITHSETLLPMIDEIFLLFAIIFLTRATMPNIQVKPTAKINTHQNIVPTVVPLTRYSMIFTFSPFTVTSVIPAIDENISIIPSISRKNHRKISIISS